MTPEALLALLETIGYPVAYRAWVDPPELPYIVYLFNRSEDFTADDQNYHDIGVWQVELYSKLKDPAAEAAVESVLKAASIPYDKSETYLESEDLTEILYIIAI